ncbi:MAG: hypothetical protein P8X75_00285 [Limibacillus sp.]|jgi:hypothetical protein
MSDSKRSNSNSEVHRRQRGKNLAMLAGLVTLVVLFYIVAILRMS